MIPSLPAGPCALRTLTHGDLGDAEALLGAAFPRPANRRVELERGLAAGPDGWFLALVDDTPAGLVGALACGRQAWVGLMAVHPRFQSRGIGRALMTRVLAHLAARGTETVILDASPAGQPLYVSLGFAPEDASWRFERAPGLPAPREPDPVPEGFSIGPARAHDLPDLAAFEAERYGADRRTLLARYLEELPERFLLARDAGGSLAGYLCAQDQRLGPWVAASAGVAAALLDRALRLEFAPPVHVFVPERNAAARDLLLRRGFQPAFANRHLRRGPGTSPERREEIYGQSGFAFG